MVTLSPRQQQLLRLYSVGCTDTDAAAELRIGVETVKEHGKALREKLQARSRAHCVAKGLQHGLISPDPAANDPVYEDLELDFVPELDLVAATVIRLHVDGNISDKERWEFEWLIELARERGLPS